MTDRADVLTDRANSVFEFRHDSVENVGRFTRIEGRAVPYNTWANVGSYMERFVAGAFAKSIRESAAALPLMLFHGIEDRWPIGLATKWQSKDDGLYGTWQLNDSPNAQRAAAMAKSGELAFLSIGFVGMRGDIEQCADTHYQPLLGEDHMDRITRTEARLVETSIVATPAYADAQVLSVRNYRRPTLELPKLTTFKRAWQAERAQYDCKR